MNRLELRGRVAELSGVRSNENDPGQVAALNRAIDAGLKRITQELPEALSPQQVQVNIPAEITPPSGVVMKTTADPYVMEFANASSHPAPTTGIGDGIYELWVDVTVAGANTYIARYICREFWSTSAPDKFYVSLEKQWVEGTVSAGWSNWRLRCPRLYLPAGVISVVSARAWGPYFGGVEIEALEEAVMRGHEAWAITDATTTAPRSIQRERAFKLVDPNKAPSYTIEEAIGFGAEPIGEFDYCYTYAWGYRNARENTPNGNKQALWESSPSPLLEGVVVPNVFSQVKLIVPKIDWQLNFGDGGTLRVGRSGYYIRIYRKRKSISGGTNQNIEIGEVYQFLADVDGNAGEFLDNGSNIPDYHLRLPEIQGYYAWNIFPTVTTRTEYNFHLRMAPPPLRNDYDAPKIEPNHVETLAMFAAHEYCLASDIADKALMIENQAMEGIGRFKRNISRSGAVFHRRPSTIGWDGDGSCDNYLPQQSFMKP